MPLETREITVSNTEWYPILSKGGTAIWEDASGPFKFRFGPTAPVDASEHGIKREGPEIKRQESWVGVPQDTMLHMIALNGEIKITVHATW